MQKHKKKNTDLDFLLKRLRKKRHFSKKNYFSKTEFYLKKQYNSKLHIEKTSKTGKWKDKKSKTSKCTSFFKKTHVKKRLLQKKDS